MPGLDDYQSPSQIEALLKPINKGLVDGLVDMKAYLHQLLESRAEKSDINPMGMEVSVELYPNPNVGAGSARDGYRSPGSPGFGQLRFFPVGTHISGGVDGDARDSLMKSGTATARSIGTQQTKDLKQYMKHRNRGIFHGASGERAVVDVSTTAITYDAASDSSMVVCDDEWGVRHIDRGATLQIVTRATNTFKGNIASGHKVLQKFPSTKTLQVQGDLRAATLAAAPGGALASGDIFVNLGCYNKERDGVPEWLGNAGVYGGGDRDREFLYQGNQVTAGSQSLQVSTLERCDTTMEWIEEEYDASDRIDVTSPLGRSQLQSLAWANYSVQTQNEKAFLGFKTVTYKGRTIAIEKDASWQEWYMLNLSTFVVGTLKELGLFQNKAADTIHETRSADGTVQDLYHWIWYEKGQTACKQSRFNLLLYAIGQGGAVSGHLN